MDNVILALPMECWRWYPGYEGIAQVSTSGDVKTVDRWVTYKDGSKRLIKGRILKPRVDKKGYLRVALRRDGKRRLLYIHRMVAETFIPNPENKPQVNHRNEQKDMNFVENLSWTSAKENSNWGSRNKRTAASRLNGSLSKSVQAINPETGQVVLEFPSAREAERKGFNHGHIFACCRGERKTHKGYMWRYKQE